MFHKFGASPDNIEPIGSKHVTGIYKTKTSRAMTTSGEEPMFLMCECTLEIRPQPAAGENFLGVFLLPGGSIKGNHDF